MESELCDTKYKHKPTIISYKTDSQIDGKSISNDSGKDSNSFQSEKCDSTSDSSGIGSETSKFSFKNEKIKQIDKEKSVYVFKKDETLFTKGRIFLILGGIILTFLGMVTLIWTPFEVLLTMRTRMTPGLPPFDWWLNPPDEVYMHFYVFNITNPIEFLEGTDDIVRYEEVGPFVFIEKLEHSNVTFNANDTMTYTANRTAIFQPGLSPISIDATLYVPNLAVLGGASYLADASFFTKLGFNMLLRRLNSQPISKIRVWDYMWNYTDPLIGVAKHLMPSLVPVDNMGILERIYADFVDEVTVYINPVNSRRFFQMDQFRGKERLGYWPEKKCDSFMGSTEGVSYHQYIQRDDTLTYLRKTICRAATTYYEKDDSRYGMSAYKFILPNTFYHKIENKSDCFTLPGKPEYPNGISDVSPCFFNFPVAASLPHMYGAVPEVIEKIPGMFPDKDMHESYVIVEPYTGVPFESKARSQSNLVTGDMAGFGALKKFKQLVMPMFWIEYGQVSLPWYIKYLMYFVVVIIRNTQTYVSCFMIVLGTFIFFLGFKYYIKFIYKHFIFSYNKLDKLHFKVRS